VAQAADAVWSVAERGYLHIERPFAAPEDAWRLADALIPRLGSFEGSETLVEVIGQFIVPPPSGPPSRGFQTLHIDFGVPLVPSTAADVARWTALHVPADRHEVTARTRLVPLAALLAKTAITAPQRGELLRRVAAYGKSHGAWEGTAGYTEGSFARIIEATSGLPPALPSVRTAPGFRCGLEFASLDAEAAFLAAHGLQLDEVVEEVLIAPGEMLIFDNLAVTHGRRGRRAAGELHQRIYGHRELAVPEQVALRDHWLSSIGW
jgi:hypothetical protein